MVLPVLTKHHAEVKLGAFCEKRIPAHARDQVKLSYAIRGNSITLNEGRALFTEPVKWVTIPIAQFRFDPDSHCWSLYCADRNSKWRRHEAAKPSRDLESLIAAVDTDQTGIFWG